MSRFEIVAHRGASAYEPENTLRAVRKALELGADAIEVDVRRSKDGRIMVIHDDRLERTTNGTGYVRDHDLTALRKLDAGQGERIPLLEEVLTTVAGAVPLLIEIKEPPTVAAVSEIVKEEGLEERVRIISFFDDAVRSSAQLLPVADRGLLVARMEDHAEHLGTRCVRLGANWMMPRYTILTEELVRVARALGLRVLAWTIDDPAVAARAASLGVDGIATNRPDLLRPPL